ncbi:ferrous iron transport protein A [Dongia sp.]|uniref:FeoA family protein n=1 Tax=Dongia sp. TaxID=1977262 RepID=UPI0035B3C92A
MHSGLIIADHKTNAALRLSDCYRGWRGSIVGLAMPSGTALAWAELERRLLEMGFVEGAHIEVRHDGPIGRDPIAIRLDDTLVALRRRDAGAVLVVGRE